MTLPDWCRSLRDDLSGWLLTLQDHDHPGLFKFCNRGSLYMPSAVTGLDASALALKIAYITGTLDRFDAEYRRQWVAHIQSFQHRTERYGFLGRKALSGYFRDDAFVRDADRKRGLFGIDIPIRRAVTRQACAALLCAGAGPRYPVQSLPAAEADIITFLESFHWATDPWGAGSHVSHLVFFYKLNADAFGMTDAYASLVPVIFSWLDGIRNPETGSWYRGDPPAAQKINAAMKVLSAYAVLDKAIVNAEPLIDFCLSSVNDADGCHNADILFALHYCQRYTDHRRQDIERFCRTRLDVIGQFHQPDGAFSFYREKSQDRLFGIPISKGLRESDIHGTILFLWSLAMIAEILGLRDELPLIMPIN